VWETGEVHTGFWCGNLRARDHEDLGVEERIIFKWILKDWDRVENGLEWSGSG
jgi:hypothetical protein